MTRSRLIIILLLALGGLAFYFTHRRPSASRAGEAASIVTARVKKADFYLTFQTTGELDASHWSPVNCELQGRNLVVWTAENGTPVKAGDVVIRLDATERQEQLTQLETQLASAEQVVQSAQASAEAEAITSQAAVTKAEEALKLAGTQNKSDLEKAEGEVAFQELELETAKTKLAKQQRLAEERLVARIEVEAAKDDVTDKEFSLEKARRALENAKQKAATDERLKQLDLDGAKQNQVLNEATRQASVASALSDLSKKQEELQTAQESLLKTEIVAPGDGLLFLETVQWGDDAGKPIGAGMLARQNQMLARIVTPGKMQVACNISEMEIEQVKAGQTARVEVPALPGVKLSGTIKEIDNVARETPVWEGGVPGRKVFNIRIDLTDADKRLRPGVTALVTILVQHITQGVMVPVEAVFEEKGQAVVYQADNGTFQRVPVQLVNRNDTLAAVEGRLRPGDRVAASHPPAQLITRGKDRR
jgi:RND family efflux transporter MFP subunit